MFHYKKPCYALLLCCLALIFNDKLQAQQKTDKFKQLYEELPSANVYRTASGAPGHAYWQQRADYVINVTLDDEKQRIIGDEIITYHNNSPETLEYLWVQLDQNILSPDSDANITALNSLEKIKKGDLTGLKEAFPGGYKIHTVTDVQNNKLNHIINKTMMRIDLPKPLAPKEKFSFKVSWEYNINDGLNGGGRTGYEYFPKDGNYMYHIAQFYPRMAVYSDMRGWQHKQYLGKGEFALNFGDFVVNITAPEDHIVAATGELQNPKAVLTKEQINRLEKAKTADKPVLIVSQEEAEKNEKSRAKKTKTWTFKADNVRDFAFVSSRKLIWDAQGVKMSDGRIVMAMSYYPKEGNPLWGEYSTQSVINAIKTYSKHTFDYPYPVAISTHAKFTGMEYPMISFNFARPNDDGSYTDQIKYAMIGVIIHEVGHNWFPMIVNSDERQWAWMDEGMNSFLQYLTELEHYTNFPSRRGNPEKAIAYMKSDKLHQEPIMTNSESLVQLGNNAYGKCAVAFTILRNTIMGPRLFDHALKTYANRWKFKHPEPADFFRSMEDASGVDLDWFWRGWFYTVDHVDIAIKNVTIEEDKQTNMFLNEITFENLGGLVMPIILQIIYEDGSQDMMRYPAEIWRLNYDTITKVIPTKKKVKQFVVDPLLETADTDKSNNFFPKTEIPAAFQNLKMN